MHFGLLSLPRRGYALVTLPEAAGENARQIHVSRHVPLARVHIAMNGRGCPTDGQNTYVLRQKNRLRIGPLIRRTGDKAWKKISFNG